jgi:phosphoglycerate dehydrogenase-like enzyme
MPDDSPVDVVMTVAIPLSPAIADELNAVDGRLRVRMVTPEQRPFLRPGGGAAADAAARELAAMLAEAEVVLAAFEAPPDLLQRAPKLRWFHTFSAGIEQYVRAGFLRDGLLFTNGSGPSAVPIAEYCLMTMLMLAKSAAGYVRLQAEHRWERSLAGGELRDKTVGIVGLGQIGAETARLAKAFGCRVIGIRRSIDEPRDGVDGVDLLLPPRELPRLLGESDFVILAAPATPETEALIDARTLGQMKPSAFLINIARGSLVDEAALAEAIVAGRLAGAALDVFEPEPLRPDSALWALPQVIVTPHISSASEHFIRRQLDLAKENLRRYLHGEPLINRITPQRAY